MHIGLIGGIGPAATDYYYRHLITKFAEEKAQLELTIVHADTPTLLGNLERNEITSQVQIYQRLTERLAIAGAECVVVTSIAGHFCIDEFIDLSPLKVINMITAVNNEISSRKLNRVGILGTRTVMETRFYSGIKSAEVILLPSKSMTKVHDAYVAMASSGFVTEEQRDVFYAACQYYLQECGTDAIMLGGTDLALVFNEQNAEFPIVDCALIHANQIVEIATHQR